MKTGASLTRLLAFACLISGCQKHNPGGGAARGGMVVQVVAVDARKQPVVETLSLVGTLTPNESVEIKSETDGIVQEVLFDEGQRVEAGQLLLRLDESKFAASLSEAEANFKLSQANFDRAKQLLEDKLISRQEFDQAAAVYEVNRAGLELKRRLLKDARVVAPFAGLTGARNVSPGQVIARNTGLTSLVDLDPVKVEMNVPERFLSQLQAGQTIEFDVTAYPGRRFRGELYFIAPQLDLDTRTALVKTRIRNADLVLRGGMVANLELKLKIRDEAVVIPEVALVSSGDNSFVFVVTQTATNRVVQLRPVVVGQRLPRWTEIRSGLEAGETVVVEGHQKLGPGMAVTLAPPERAAPYRPESTQPPPPTKG